MTTRVVKVKMQKTGSGIPIRTKLDPLVEAEVIAAAETGVTATNFGALTTFFGDIYIGTSYSGGSLPDKEWYGGLIRWDETHGLVKLAENYALADYSVFCLAQFGGRIFGGTQTKLLRWDGISAWENMADSTGEVHTLCKFEGELYGGVGRWFAKWDGVSAWTWLEEASYNFQPLQLVVFEDTMYGMVYDYYGGHSYLVYWDGAAAVPLSDMAGLTLPLMVHNGKLYTLHQSDTILTLYEWNGVDAWVAKGTFEALTGFDYPAVWGTIFSLFGDLYGVNEEAFYKWNGVDAFEIFVEAGLTGRSINGPPIYNEGYLYIPIKSPTGIAKRRWTRWQ